MIPLVRLKGIDPAKKFDNVMDDSFDLSISCGRKNEPYLVRDLISETTIMGLNNAAANSYDENLNVVRFRGGFLHSRPWAVFDAYNDKGEVNRRCRRELADAILVFHLTEPDGTGAHKVVRRAACLLMFKKSGEVNPITPEFMPLGTSLPEGTDQEQFYLFNQWPKFELEVSGIKKVGKGAYNLTNSNFNIGKFSLLWDVDSKCKSWAHRWRYSDPTPSTPVVKSLGSLLASLVDSDPAVGQEFNANVISDWDKLVKDLFEYAKDHNWLGCRDVNPSGINFLSNFESTIENLATCSHYARSMFNPLDEWDRYNYHLLNWLYRGKQNITTESQEGGIPIIFATANSFKSQERGEEPSIRSRHDLVLTALRDLAKNSTS